MLIKTTDSTYGEYLLDGKKFYQFPLTGAQKIYAVKLLAPTLKKFAGMVKPVLKTEGLSSAILDKIDEFVGLLDEVDVIPGLIGVILLGENEKVSDLMNVHDFGRRGLEMMSLMKNEEEVEILKDFFQLNRTKIDILLRAVGISLSTKKNLPPSSGASAEILNS